MKQFIFSVTFIINALTAFSQFSVNIESSHDPFYASDGDTLSLCTDSVITLKAFASDNGTPVSGAFFHWDFDDNQQISGTDKDSVTHFYTKGGGYRVKLTVRFGSSEILKIIPVHVSMKPVFTDTKQILPEAQTGICRGGKAELFGKALSPSWKDKLDYTVKLNPAVELSHISSDTITIFIDEFPENAVFSANALDSVGFSAEHSDMGSLEVKMICPNKSEVMLKNFSASNHAFLGVPVSGDDNPTQIGTMFQYFWSENGASSTMNNATGTSIAAGTYLPEQSFSAFLGCPMNGKWKLVVTDNSPTDNGFTDQFKLLFDKTFLPPVWTFRDTLIEYFQKDTIFEASYWESTETVGSTILSAENDSVLTGTTIGRPKVTSAYKYNVVNNRGCTADTSVTVKVERVEMNVIPEALTLAEYDTLTAKVPKTVVSWAHEYDWNFGDQSAHENTESVEHFYKRKGDYQLIVIVSDSSGCSDTDTAMIKVTLEKTEIEMTFNCFTPNDDGNNDIFTMGKAKGLLEFAFYIFNEWGQKVYETHSAEDAVDKGWDGKLPVSKMRASPGIYYYYIRALGKDQKEYKLKGALHLLR